MRSCRKCITVVAFSILTAILVLRTFRDSAIGHPGSRVDVRLAEQHSQAGLSYNTCSLMHGETLRQRLHAYSICLEYVRHTLISQRKNASWLAPSSELHIIRGAEDDYLAQLSNFSHVYTAILPWNKSGYAVWDSRADERNVLIRNYFEWTADDPLCRWIESPGVIKMKYDAFFNRSCSRNISIAAERSVSMKPLFFNIKPIWRNTYWPNDGNAFPQHFYTNPPDFVTYLHVYTDAIINSFGDSYSRDLKIVLYQCSYEVDKNLKPPQNANEAPLYDEVFVIAQHWGSAVFHRMVEVLPRLAPYVDFLSRNPHIKVLATEGPGGRLGELMQLIGLNESRLIIGLTRAKIVYQPRPSGCGMALVQETQLLSALYRKYIQETFGNQHRNRLILIRRSGGRRFTEQKAIEEAVQRSAAEYGLKYTLFRDDPTPSLNETMIMFNSAVMVVGPHGAGLSNIVFCEPGTFVVEGVCNLPHVNFCFQRLSHVLGNRWHGIPSRRGCEGVVDISAHVLEKAVKIYLNVWLKSASKLQA